MKIFEKYINEIVNEVFDTKLTKKLKCKSKKELKSLLLEEAKKERRVIDWFKFSCDDMSDIPDWFTKKISIREIYTTESGKKIAYTKAKNFDDFKFEEVQGMYCSEDKGYIDDGEYVLLFDNLEIATQKEMPNIN